MGLYRRDSVWWMRFTYNGKQLRRSTEVTDKKLAEKIYCKVITDIVEGKWFEINHNEDKTFSEMMQKYLTEHFPKKALKTHKRDKSLSFHLNQYFGHFRLNEISPRLIYEYKVKRHQDGVAPKTVNNELGISHAMNLAMKEWEWVDSNPVSRVTKERVHNEIIRWLTFGEERCLLDASPKWLREIIIFALNTGLRREELIDLTWDRIDIANRTFTILEQKNRGKDTLPLNEKAMGILIKRNAVISTRNKYVFYNKNGNRFDPNSLSRSFRVMVKKAGIEKFRYHDLRHTFATRLIHRGVDIYTVQRLGRWKSIQMVMRYAHHHAESL